jgi:hypothetical protein
LVIWECAIAGPARIPVHEVVDLTATFLHGVAAKQSIAGNWPVGVAV